MTDTYDETSEQQPSSEERGVIESATASTACQTNDSNFAYILSGCVLGGVVLLACAVVVLFFAIASSGTSSYSTYGYGDGYGYDDGYGNGYSDEYGYDDGYSYNYNSGWAFEDGSGEQLL